MAEMKSKRTLTLDEEKQKALDDRQQKALERREKFLARKNKEK